MAVVALQYAFRVGLELVTLQRVVDAQEARGEPVPRQRRKLVALLQRELDMTLFRLASLSWFARRRRA